MIVRRRAGAFRANMGGTAEAYSFCPMELYSGDESFFVVPDRAKAGCPAAFPPRAA